MPAQSIQTRIEIGVPTRRREWLLRRFEETRFSQAESKIVTTELVEMKTGDSHG